MMALISSARRRYRDFASRHPRLGAVRANRLLFDNGRPLRINLRFLRHWLTSRRTFAPVAGKERAAAVTADADALTRTGFTVVEPPRDRSIVSALAAQVEDLVAAGHVTITPGVEEWMIQIDRAFERMPDLAKLMTPHLVDVLEAAYGSHFKIYSIEVYRLVPSESFPEASSLWHTDNYPPGMLKAMFYLTDTDHDTGALRVHPWPTTRRLLRRGFMNRYDAARYAPILDEGWIALAGRAGTTVLWNSNVAHKATPPRAGLRDAVAFKFLPSSEPWSAHLSRAGSRVCYEERKQIPDDPAAD